MNWKKVESTVRPEEFDDKSSQVYNYVRKNIEEKQLEEENGTPTVYVYDELAVSKEDWILFNELTESTTRIAEVEDAVIELAEIIEGGE